MYLINTDPGYERIKQAFKTVLSIVLVVAIFVWHFSGPGVLLAGFCTAALSICHEGENTKQQMISMLIAALCFVSAICIGVLLSDYLVWFYFIFVLVCFLAFYVREKYGPRYLSFPIFSLLIMLISFNLPNVFKPYVYLMIALAGCSVAFIVNFCLLPVNMKLQLKHNYKVFFYKYDQIVVLLLNGVSKAKKEDYYRNTFLKIDSLIDKLRNERLLTKGLPLNVNRRERMTQNVVYQYELFKLLSMINESLMLLSTHKLDNNIILLQKKVLKNLSEIVMSAMNLLAADSKTETVSFDCLDASLAEFKKEASKSIGSGINSISIVFLSNFVFGVTRTALILGKQLELLKIKEDIEK